MLSLTILQSWVVANSQLLRSLEGPPLVLVYIQYVPIESQTVPKRYIYLCLVRSDIVYIYRASISGFEHAPSITKTLSSHQSRPLETHEYNP